VVRLKGVYINIYEFIDNYIYIYIYIYIKKYKNKKKKNNIKKIKKENYKK